jgi:hypothetical protein
MSQNQTEALTVEQLTHYGIELADEGRHPFDPDTEWWNESWFWDWFNDDGTLAGHCRFGLHPVQKRAWLWLLLYRDGEWVVLEEPRLPIDGLEATGLAYRSWGLDFQFDATDPLRNGRLRVSGFGRVVSGPRAGTIRQLGADLTFSALGAAHTSGRGSVEGHSSQTYDSCRFEQPVRWSGELSFDNKTVPFEGRGERDHSWGPRHWDMDWRFVIGNGERMRFMCTQVHIPGIDPIGIGYVSCDEHGTRSLAETKVDVVLRDDNVLDPFDCTIEFRDEDGREFQGRVETISAAELDISHCFSTPQRSFYRRALVRIHLTGIDEPLLGWCEVNQREPELS